MKIIQFKILLPALLTAGSILLSATAFSQTKKLPDGTIVYNDGTKKLPNGTVIYKGGTIEKNGNDVRLPDGSVILRDGTRNYPNNKTYKRKKNGKWMPPGQAKKVYGGSAKDYAHGQKKHKHKHHKKYKAHKD